jgi:hypothetical protein
MLRRTAQALPRGRAVGLELSSGGFHALRAVRPT